MGEINPAQGKRSHFVRKLPGFIRLQAISSESCALSRVLSIRYPASSTVVLKCIQLIFIFGFGATVLGTHVMKKNIHNAL